MKLDARQSSTFLFFALSLIFPQIFQNHSIKKRGLCYFKLSAIVLDFSANIQILLRMEDFRPRITGDNSFAKKAILKKVLILH